MGKLLINFDNRSDFATLSSDGAAPLVPLANLQSPRLEYPWRSASTDLADTRFDVTFDEFVPMRGIFLVDLNTTSGALIRARGYADEARTTLTVDSEWQIILGGAPDGSLDFIDPGWWLGVAPWADPWRRPMGIVIFAEPVLSQFWTIEIDDQDNAAGFIEARRLWMSRYITPRYNFAPDAGLSFGKNMREQTGFIGQRRKQQRAMSPKRFSFNIQYLPNADVIGGDFADLNINTGFVGEALVCIDDGATGLALQQQTFLGQIEDASPFSYQAPDYQHVGYTFEEIIR